MAIIGEFDAVEAARERLVLKVRVTRVREYRLRVWLVEALLRIVGWVAPMPVTVEMVERHEGRIA